MLPMTLSQQVWACCQTDAAPLELSLSAGNQYETLFHPPWNASRSDNKEFFAGVEMGNLQGKPVVFTDEGTSNVD
jgi:hypothetical protein